MSAADTTTAGALSGALPPTRDDASTAPLSFVLRVIGLTYVALLLVSAPNLADPFLRNDDYPALLSMPEGFYSKTLHEGRWLNYWWHLRGVVTPTWLNFALYQAFWAAFCGATAVVACRPGAGLRPVMITSLLIMLAVPSLLISLWFNTLLPGLAITALYAVLATRLPARVMRWLLLLFVPITLTAYTTYPIMLFCICLAAADSRRSWRDLIGLVLLFGTSFALGLVCINTLNLIEHGVFGIPMADWRNPTPVTDLASLMGNLGVLASSLWQAALVAGFQILPLVALSGLVFLAAFRVLFRHDPWSGWYLLTGLAVGLGLLSLQVVLTGIVLPQRTMGFAWMVLAIAAVRALRVLQADGLRSARWMRLGVLTVLGAHLVLTPKQYFSYTHWQQETREFAAAITAGQGPLYAVGDYDALQSAQTAFLQAPQALRLRLFYLTERPIIVCSETPERCPEFPPHAGDLPTVVQMPDKMVLYLPRLDAAANH